MIIELRLFYLCGLCALCGKKIWNETVKKDF
jgi:hypothetical protein